METFAEHNFGNDQAMEYLSMLTAKLVATITEIIADPERMELDEDGEGMLMPSVEILALLCERYNAMPPKPATVHQWSQKYLKMYDHCIDEISADADFKVARRKVIDHTFRWLEGLGESYWDR
ncbi:MAG TPA: hypothetical protein VN688_15160 [Gemmataceae bacterium]|nr:hypothetical protein [Gemmataceae bacterium]